MSKEFNINKKKLVLALFSIKANVIRLYIGETTKNTLTDSKAKDIISSLTNILNQNNYYEAFLKYYDNMDSKISTNKNNNNKKKIAIIIFLVFIFIFILIIIYSNINCFCSHLPNNRNLKYIVIFLRYQKTNKQIFKEKCIICLKNLKIVKIIDGYSEQKEKIELTKSKNDINNILFKKIEDRNRYLIEKENYDKELIEKEENGISTLICGHKFHTNCIIKWLKLKNNCPICTQLFLDEKDNNKIVWTTQIELYPEFNHINYDDLYIKNFDYFGDIGGDIDCGDIGGGDYGGGDCGGGDCGGGD